ncbi:MAG TPA: MBL fold metallo-hydrolase [Prolixibacteraceae bacterium]|nr:MBL fold metallo-hydrolase [Prolixibacteraceae bacterium]
MRNENFTFKSVILSGILCCTGFGASVAIAQDSVAIHNLGHASLHMEYNDLQIYVDPYSAVADFDTLPDADIILITHQHQDHYDLTALDKIKKESTIMITTQTVEDLGTYDGEITVLGNGDSTEVMDVWVKAVPAYNIFNTNFHPKGVGNGYVLTFGQKKIYVAGDTENIPEMRLMGKIDIAFLPMNLPYTMTPAEASTAALNIMPDILYIYHYGQSDTALIRALLKDYIDEIRIGPSTFYENVEQDATPNEQDYLAPDLVFYPNPVKDFLFISKLSPNSEISVFDMSGKLMLKQRMTGQGDQKIDLKALKAGAYLIRYHNNEVVKSSMILKE